jgi:hypothetical protein
VKCFVAAILLLIAINANAELWDAAVTSETGTTFFYDPTNIIRDGNMVKYWELENYSKPLIAGNIILLSSKIQMLVDCQNKKYKNLNIFDYSKSFATGDLVHVDLTGNSPWNLITPGSVDNALFDFVCKAPPN